MKNTSVSINAPVQVEYSTSQNGVYTPYVRVSPSSGSLSLDELVSNVRRHLICSPSFVREHVPEEIVKFTARFWFRFLTSAGRIYFSLDISSSDLNSISRRVAAL